MLLETLAQDEKIIDTIAHETKLLEAAANEGNVGAVKFLIEHRTFKPDESLKQSILSLAKEKASEKETEKEAIESLIKKIILMPFIDNSIAKLDIIYNLVLRKYQEEKKEWPDFEDVTKITRLYSDEQYEEVKQLLTSLARSEHPGAVKSSKYFRFINEMNFLREFH